MPPRLTNALALWAGRWFGGWLHLRLRRVLLVGSLAVRLGAVIRLRCRGGRIALAAVARACVRSIGLLTRIDLAAARLRGLIVRHAWLRSRRIGRLRIVGSRWLPRNARSEERRVGKECVSGGAVLSLQAVNMRLAR